MANTGPSYNNNQTWPMTSGYLNANVSSTSGFGSLGVPGYQTITTGGTSPEIRFDPPLATAVSVMADGSILITLPFGSAKVPPALFKDLVALATMGLLEKMAPEEAEHAR